MRLLLLRQQNLSEEMERGQLRFPWTNICMLRADTVLPECDKTETLQGDARICQDSLHSSQRYVSAINRVPTRPGKSEYTWKTWKNHGILKHLINIMENDMKPGKTGWLLKIHP